MFFDIGNAIVNIAKDNSKDWIDISSALLTPVVAILGCFIAYRQWKTSEKQRKQDLFDKRYENLFNPILNCIKEINSINGSKISNKTKLKKIETVTQKFGEQYFKYRFLISQQDDEKLNKEYQSIVDMIKNAEHEDIEDVVLFLLVFKHFNEIEKTLSKYLRIEPNSYFYNMKQHFRKLNPKTWKKYSFKDINDMLRKQKNSLKGKNDARN